MFFNSQKSNLMCSVMALALFSATATPASAQLEIDRMPQNPLDVLKILQDFGRNIDAGLKTAEEFRLAGDCNGRQRALDSVEQSIRGLEEFTKNARGKMFDPQERINDARARKKDIAEAACPPLNEAPPSTVLATPNTPSNPPSDGPTGSAQPAAPLPVQREPGQTRTLDDLKIEYAAAACGTEAEKAEARDRLLTAYDRAIAIERSPQKRDRMIEQRQRVSDGTVGQKPCPKPAETPAPQVGQAGPPLTMEELNERSALRFAMVEDIEKAFNLAERARLAGNCSYRDNVLGSIRMKVGKAADQAGTPDDADTAAWDEWRSRLADAEKRPCPPLAAPVSPIGMLPDKGISAEEYRDREAQLAKDIDDSRKRRYALIMAAYYAYSFIPRTAIGVRRDGAPGAAPEVDAGRTARRVNSLGISAGFQTKIDPNMDLRLSGNYLKGDATTDISVPATSAAQRVDTGIVYGRLSNGSSGVIAGGGGTGSTKTDLTDWGLKADIGHDFGKIRIGFGASYDRVETKHDLSYSSSVVSGGFTFNFAQDRLQRLDESYYGLYGSAEATIPICPDADFKLEVIGGPVWRDTDWEGVERNTANFGPMGNRDLTHNFADKQGSWGAYGKAGASVEYRIGSGASLIFGGNFEYRSEVGKVIVPNSGDQVFFEGQTNRLGQDDASAWNAFFGARFSF